MRCFWRFWMMCTSSPNQMIELAMCIWRFKRNSTDMPVSGFMPAKRRCGTQLVNDLRPVLFWSGLLRRKIRRHEHPHCRAWSARSGDYVQTQLTQKLVEHDMLLQHIPLVTDVQSAWSLLLHCAGGRANYLLRVVRPELVGRFALGHNFEGDGRSRASQCNSDQRISILGVGGQPRHAPRTTPHRGCCNRGKSGPECGHVTNVGLSCACSPPPLWCRRV